jgi:hypothetical protein
LVLRTNAQVNPPPVTLVTVVLGPERESVATKARSNSFPELVENAEVVTALAAVDLSLEVFASMAIAPRVELAISANNAKKRKHENLFAVKSKTRLARIEWLIK